MSASAELFTPAGIADWRARLNRSAQFADAAAGWHGILVLVEHPAEGAERRTLIEVTDGVCTVARLADTADDAHAEFVLAASPATWDDLVAARVSPTMAAFAGKLRLMKGEIMRLVPHAKAAAALLAAAARGDRI